MKNTEHGPPEKKTAKVQYIEIDESNEGQRLDNFLFTYLKGVPKTHIYRIIRKGEVRVNKGRIQPQYKLNVGDKIRIPPLNLSRSDNPDNKTYDRAYGKKILNAIIYEDDDVMVLNKPSGLASHGGSGLTFGAIELLRHLNPQLKFLELVHRLDRDTSGCLVLAKNRKTLLFIQEQFKTGNVTKRYLTLVKGRWRGGDKINAPLKKNILTSGERMVKVHPEGQASETKFEIKEVFKQATLMVAMPITGRTHQIRVHAASIGNGVALDLKYGDEGFNRTMKDYGLKRLFLHAESMSFNLPDIKERFKFEAPMDTMLLEVLEKLRSKNSKEMRKG